MSSERSPVCSLLVTDNTTLTPILFARWYGFKALIPRVVLLLLLLFVMGLEPDSDLG